MPRSRDRHGRGLRGPLAHPSAARGTAPALRRGSRTEFFAQCVRDAVDEIARHNPRALHGIRVGVEEVPHLTTAWSGERVPLAAALEATETRSATIVVYERPLEFRSRNRDELRRLVHRTVCEQLSALTGLQLEELGPDTLWDED